MLVICKIDQDCKGGDISWDTASTKSRNLLITWSRDKCKTLYLHFRIVVTYGGGTPPAKWRELLITWSIISEKNLYLHFQNTYSHQNWQTYGRKTSPAKSHDLLTTWSCDNCKTLYMHFCNTYGYQTWESGNLQWGAPPSKSRELLIMWSRG